MYAENVGGYLKINRLKENCSDSVASNFNTRTIQLIAHTKIQYRDVIKSVIFFPFRVAFTQSGFKIEN